MVLEPRPDAWPNSATGGTRSLKFRNRSMRLLPIAYVLAVWLMAARALAAAVAPLPVARLAPALPAPLSVPGVENAYRVTDRILSGSQPEGDEALEALRKLGVKTIVSVDGTAPDVERAAEFGLRYVHVPHGYDGIPSNTAVRLAKAAAVLPGPIFVHCHHGKHRGPAAVGIMCRATAGWSTNQVASWMKLAGTSPDYAGLYRDNLAFQVPTPDFLDHVPSDFPSRAAVSGLVESMVEVDHRWDNLQAIVNAGWKAPLNHPDLVPTTEALLLAESFREFGRLPGARDKGPEFLHAASESDRIATELHGLLKAGSVSGDRDRSERAGALLKSLGAGCASCHRKFRN